MPPTATEDTLLAEAKRRLGVVGTARHLGIDLRQGLQRSPFRDDDRNPSFSVYTRDGEEYFKDHGCPEHSGSGWDLIALARPGLSAREIRAFMVSAAGLRDDPAAKKPHKSTLKAISRQQEILRDQAREAALTIVAKPPPAPLWPDPIRARYAEGYNHLKADPVYQSRIAASRGWFDDAVEDLLHLGHIAAPRLPWADDRRGLAFLVHRPQPVDRTAGRHLQLIPVGYHQRFSIHRPGGERSTSWLYVPHVPRSHGNISEFQRFLLQHNAGIPAYPFVLGNLNAPPLIVITEGQWDAATLRAAAGPALSRAAIFGIRGASGTDIFLAAYGDWLRAIKPIVWIIADNDDAGRRWLFPPQPDLTKPPAPCFVHQLKAFGAARVVTSWLRSGRWGKDFNDYYRHHMPEPHHIAAWMRSLDLEPHQ